MKTIVVFCVCVVAVGAIGAVLSPYHVARVTVRVVDEQGMPVTNATAGIGFSKNIPPGEGWGTRPFSIRGQTDSNGIFSAEAEGNPTVSSSARREGYYATMGDDFMFTNVVVDHWQPWDPKIEITLKKILNPVPMYAKRVETTMPAMNESCGYDLEKGDWTGPYGKGLVRDLIFTFSGRFVDARDRDESLEITFSHSLDGLQDYSAPSSRGSNFRFPYEAPTTGYCNQWTRGKIMRKADGYRQNQELRPDQNFIFRVRSVPDDGEIKSAKYGKIKGDFEFGYAASNQVLVVFTYYLNPTPNDRNLEFDPKHNLLTGLTPSESPTDP